MDSFDAKNILNIDASKKKGNIYNISTEFKQNKEKLKGNFKKPMLQKEIDNLKKYNYDYKNYYDKRVNPLSSAIKWKKTYIRNGQWMDRIHLIAKDTSYAERISNLKNMYFIKHYQILSDCVKDESKIEEIKEIQSQRKNKKSTPDSHPYFSIEDYNFKNLEKKSVLIKFNDAFYESFLRIDFNEKFFNEYQFKQRSKEEILEMLELCYYYENKFYIVQDRLSFDISINEIKYIFYHAAKVYISNNQDEFEKNNDAIQIISQVYDINSEILRKDNLAKLLRRNKEKEEEEKLLVEELRKVESKVKKDTTTPKDKKGKAPEADLKNIYANSPKQSGAILASALIFDAKQDAKFKSMLYALRTKVEFCSSRQTLPKINELKKLAANFLSLSKHLKRKRDELNYWEDNYREARLKSATYRNTNNADQSANEVKEYPRRKMIYQPDEDDESKMSESNEGEGEDEDEDQKKKPVVKPRVGTYGANMQDSDDGQNEDKDKDVFMSDDDDMADDYHK